MGDLSCPGPRVLPTEGRGLVPHFSPSDLDDLDVIDFALRHGLEDPRDDGLRVGAVSEVNTAARAAIEPKPRRTSRRR
jgi:hypothetical protein